MILWCASSQMDILFVHLKYAVMELDVVVGMVMGRRATTMLIAELGTPAPQSGPSLFRTCEPPNEVRKVFKGVKLTGADRRNFVLRLPHLRFSKIKKNEDDKQSAALLSRVLAGYVLLADH